LFFFKKSKILQFFPDLPWHKIYPRTFNIHFLKLVPQKLIIYPNKSSLLYLHPLDLAFIYTPPRFAECRDLVYTYKKLIFQTNGQYQNCLFITFLLYKQENSINQIRIELMKKKLAIFQIKTNYTHTLSTTGPPPAVSGGGSGSSNRNNRGSNTAAVP